MRALALALALLLPPLASAEEPLEQVAHFEGRVERSLEASVPPFLLLQAPCARAPQPASWHDQGELRVDLYRARDRLLAIMEYFPEVSGHCPFRAALEVEPQGSGWTSTEPLAGLWEARFAVTYEPSGDGWQARYHAESSNGQHHALGGAVGRSL